MPAPDSSLIGKVARQLTQAPAPLAPNTVKTFTEYPNESVHLHMTQCDRYNKASTRLDFES